jgi:hypothetical protein
VKGTPNRFTTTIKAAIAGAFDEVGGQQYLIDLAKSDPRTFCTLLGKIVPTAIEGGDPENPIQHVAKVEFHIVKGPGPKA